MLLLFSIWVPLGPNKTRLNILLKRSILVSKNLAEYLIIILTFKFICILFPLILSCMGTAGIL